MIGFLVRGRVRIKIRVRVRVHLKPHVRDKHLYGTLTSGLC